MVVVSISPSAVTVDTDGSVQFHATVSGTADTQVSWSANGITGGTASFGTISSRGFYTPPAVPPSPNTVIVSARSVVNPSSPGSASVTVVNPAPVLTTISPNQVNSGSPDTTLVVTGSGLAQQSVVEASGVVLSTKVASSTQLTATLPATMLLNAGTLVVTVMTPGPGGGTSSAANLKVSAVVVVSPAPVAPLTGTTQQFTATVTGTSVQDVTWSIDGAASGNATVGTISATGLYAAPAVVPYPPVITVRAVSSFDNTVSGAANVTMASPAEDWPKFQRDLSNTGRSIETGIGSSTVNLLQVKWKFNTGGTVGASPAVATVNGVRTVFIGSGTGIFYALDADTGAVRWSFPVDMNGSCTVAAGCMLASSPAVQNGIVYFGTGNDDIYALNASDGSLVWKVRVGDPFAGYEIWSSPAVYNGVVYVGRASNEGACIPGKVLALDALTGAAVWTFDTIDQSTCPNGGQCGGANVWAPPAIDPLFGTLFIGTGDPNPGSLCTAVATLYPETLLALDLNTGALKSYFSAGSSTDVFDLDIGSAATLFETQTVDGCAGQTQTSYWVEVASKNTQMYVLPRGSSGITGQPIIVNLDGSTLISSPAAVPFISSQPCGAGSSQIVTTETDLYEPSGAGNLFDFHMSLDGTLTTPWQLPVIPCPSGNTFPCSVWSSPAAMTDLLFFGANNNNIYAATTGGAMVWTFATEGIVASSPAFSHSALYFGSADGNVYCLTINGK